MRKGEDIEPTVHPKVLVWRHQPTEWENVQQVFDELTDLKTSNDHEKIVAVLKKIVPEYELRNSLPDEAESPGRAGSAVTAGTTQDSKS